MWEPPKEKIKKMGRLNKPGENLLYTSFAEPDIAVYEARIEEGDYFALIKYSSLSEVKTNLIGGEYDLKELFSNDTNSIIVFNLINDFLRDEFSRDVGQGTEFLYRISECIAKAWFDGPPREVQDAWAYCSIIDKHKYNVCFRPEIAHEILNLHGAIICKKDERRDINPLCIAVPSQDDGKVEYFRMETEIQKKIFPEIVVTEGDTYDQL